MNRSLLSKACILGLVLIVSLSSCKWPWKKDKDDSGGGGTSVDNSPSISITIPADGATISGTVSVTVSASDDNGTSKAKFYIDGVIKSTDSVLPYSYSWDTTAETEGSHIVKVIVYDTVNQPASDQHTVTVDNVLASGEWRIIDTDLVVVGTGGEQYLMWPRDKDSEGCNSNQRMNWFLAMSWAEELVYNGYDDWRLATKEELKQLYAYGRIYISYTTHIHWSSTEQVPYAYGVDFYNGNVGTGSKHDAYYLRAVRSSP